MYKYVFEGYTSTRDTRPEQFGTDLPVVEIFKESPHLEILVLLDDNMSPKHAYFKSWYTLD